MLFSVLFILAECTYANDLKLKPIFDNNVADFVREPNSGNWYTKIDDATNNSTGESDWIYQTVTVASAVGPYATFTLQSPSPFPVIGIYSICARVQPISGSYSTIRLNVLDNNNVTIDTNSYEWTAPGYYNYQSSEICNQISIGTLIRPNISAPFPWKVQIRTECSPGVPPGIPGGTYSETCVFRFYAISFDIQNAKYGVKIQ